ncbi:MAG: hypothetical protein EA382_15070, partial [Spirochaetaceae bacterium]
MDRNIAVTGSTDADSSTTDQKEHIYRLLRQTSRTFALSIEGLPGVLRDEIATSYLLLRVSDYFEDHESLPTDQKIRLLEQWHAVLSAEAADDSGLDRTAGRESDGCVARHAFAAALATVPVDPADPEEAVAREWPVLLAVLSGFGRKAIRVIV